MKKINVAGIADPPWGEFWGEFPSPQEFKEQIGEIRWPGCRRPCPACGKNNWFSKKNVSFRCGNEGCSEFGKTVPVWDGSGINSRESLYATALAALYLPKVPEVCSVAKYFDKYFKNKQGVHIGRISAKRGVILLGEILAGGHGETGRAFLIWAGSHFLPKKKNRPPEEEEELSSGEWEERGCAGKSPGIPHLSCPQRLTYFGRAGSWGRGKF